MQHQIEANILSQNVLRIKPVPHYRTPAIADDTTMHAQEMAMIIRRIKVGLMVREESP